MDLIKVSATSRTAAVAGAIGAGAVNQAVKALVLATGYLKEAGINVSLYLNLPMSLSKTK